MKKISYLGEIFFFLCLLGILYLWYVIYKPFLGVFLIAAAITSIFYPAYLGIMQKSKRIGPSLASLLMVFAISFIVIIPLILFLLYLSTQVGGFYDWLMKIFDSGFLTVWVDKFNALISRFFEFSLNEETVLSYFTNIGSGLNQWLLSATSSIINNAFQLVTNFLFLIVCLFFMFRDGKKILVRIMQWTPLHDRYDLEIYKKFQEVSYAALLATFLTALAQAVVSSESQLQSTKLVFGFGNGHCFHYSIVRNGLGLGADRFIFYVYRCLGKSDFLDFVGVNRYRFGG